MTTRPTPRRKPAKRKTPPTVELSTFECRVLAETLPTAVLYDHEDVQAIYWRLIHHIERFTK